MTTRGRLTGTYFGLLAGTLIVFSVALFMVYGNLTDDVGVEAQRAADSLVTTILRRQVALNRARDTATKQLPDSQLTVWVTQVKPDSSSGTANALPTQLLIDLLRDIPGYFLVYNTQDKLLYASASMKALDTTDQDAVNQIAGGLAPGLESARLHTGRGNRRLFLLSRRVSNDSISVPNISRVVVAVPMSLADLLGPALSGSFVLVVPFVLLLSWLAAYGVLGSVFRPVDQLINEVEAITDGRSLHRRLPTDASNDEMARLSVTLNAMLTRLENSFAALRRFTADASHELKTPLTVLRADVERAMHPATPRTEKLVALEEALQETARMADLVEGLLTLARADEGRFDIHPEPVDLESLIREVYETATILGEDAGLTLALDAVDSATLMGDRTRLRQLLLNLVTNAIKYTPRGGHVELSATRRSDEEIAISVRDTGIGMSAADLPHVFDRFWRADRVRSRASERGGFGLGLAISQWIVQAHGGTISVQSRLGRGTIFTVVLPIVPDQSPIEQAQPETEIATEAADT